MSIDIAFERLREANPVPQPELLRTEDHGVAVLRTPEPWRRVDMDTKAIDRKPAPAGSRRNWLLALAGVVALALVGIGNLASDTESRAQSPLGVAEEFVTAVATWDIATTSELLATDANVRHPPATSSVDWGAQMRWRETIGLGLRLEGCEQPIATDPAVVVCSAVPQSPWADALGVEVTETDVYRLRVVDGVVVSLTVRLENAPAQMAQVWNSFHEWVAEHHPDALMEMHRGGGVANPVLETVSLTDDSIEQWAEMTDLFTASTAG
jgi:hypothetical protein